MVGITKIKFKIRFGELLVKSGIITQEQIEKAIKIQKQELNKGNSILIGEIITKLYKIPKKKIETIFAKYLFITIAKHFYNTIISDNILKTQLGESNHIIEKMDFKIPYWKRIEKKKSKEISGKITFLIKPKGYDIIEMNVPFDYIIEEQISNIDLLGALDIVREKVIESKRFMDFNMNNLGISIAELNNE